MADEFVDDSFGTRSSEFIFVEAVPDGIAVLPQALWIGVRPGYGPEGQRLPEPAIWVQYQQRYMNSRLTGLVAISPESWDKIDAAVRWRLAEWKGGDEDEESTDVGDDPDCGTADLPAAPSPQSEGQLELPFPPPYLSRLWQLEVMHPDNGPALRS